MDWSFSYTGPKEKAVDPDCPICVAAVMKGCKQPLTPDHPTKNDTPGCAHCEAAKTGVCKAHAGVDVALADAKPPANLGLYLSELVKSALASAPEAKQVAVHAHADAGLEDNHAVNLRIDISAR